MHDGSITFSTALDNADLEKELGRLKKKILRQMEDIGRTEFKRNDLEEQLKAANETLELLNKIKAPVDADIAWLNELHARIPKIEAEIRKCNEAIRDGNASLEYTKVRYGEILEETGRIRPDEGGTGLEKLSKEAAEVNKRLHELAERYADLGEKCVDFDPNEGEFLSLRQEIKDCVLYLDELAESGQLAELASGAEIAEDRIADLTRTIETYEDRLENLDLTEEQQDILTAKVEKGKRLLEEYQAALDRVVEQANTLQKPQQVNPDNAKRNEAQTRLSAYLEKTSALYQKLNGTMKQTTELSSVLQEMAAATTGKMSGMLQTTGTALGSFSAKLSGAVAAAGPYIAVILAVAAALKKLFDMMWKFGQEATGGVISYMKTIAKLSVSAAQSFVELLKSIGKFSSSAMKSISQFAKKALEFSQNFNVFSKLTDSLSGKFKRLGNTIKSALVFSVIYKGLSLLRQQVGAYLSVNTEFTTALRRLQGVLLTAFQPIYEIVVPALTTLINVLTRAAATVTQFFASLFGTSAKQAQINAKDLYEQANATTAAGDAAEEAAKQLAGFDEINRLDGSSSAGGGGSTSVDTGPLFDYEYDETPFDSWGEAFSAFLDKLLAGIPKLRDAFKNFADWLNDWSKKLYDMFTFPGVLDKVKQLGRDLADALNDLVNWINWYQLGQALDAGLNLALNFLTSFIYEFDWINLGRKLAEFVNGLVSEIDWYEFGRLLWDGFKIGLETLAGFITGLDMPQLAEAANQIIQGFFDEMIKTIERIQWHRIGEQIALFLNNIDWYGLITSAAKALRAALIAFIVMVQEFIKTLEWHKIAEQIYTAINDSIGNETLFKNLGKTLSNLIIHIFDFIREIVAGTDWEQIGRDIAALILGFDWVGALGSLADLIAEGINAAIKLLRGFLDKIKPEIKEIAEGIAERLKEAVKSVHWDELGQVIGDAIKTALSFVAGLLDPELFYEIGKAVGEFLINLDWPGIVGGLAEALANGINSAVAAVKGFLDTVKPHLKEIADNVAQKINEFVEKVDWKELGQTLHDGIEAAIDFLLKILDQLDWDSIGQAVVDFLTELRWGELMEKWGSVVGKAIGGALKGIDLSDALSLGADIVAGLVQGMLNKWEESGGIGGWIKRKLFSPFVEGFKSLFGINSPSTVMAEQGAFIIEGLLQGISDTWHSILDFFSEKLEGLKQTLVDAWENIKETASEKWESIKKTLGDSWEAIRESAQEKFEEVRNKVKEAWENVNKDATEKWNSIKETLRTSWDAVRENAREKFEEVRQKVSEAWNNIKSDAPGKWEEIKTTLSTAWESVKSTAEEKFKDIKDKIVKKMEEIKDNDWVAAGKSVVSDILKGLESIWNSLTSWARDVKNTIAGALSSTSISGVTGSSRYAGMQPSFSSRIAVQSLPDMANYTIPKLAQGAVIPPNREFLAVLGDQKSGTNIEAPVSEIENAVTRAMRAAGMAGGGNITVVMEIDGREFGRASYKYGTAEQQRVGVRLTEART